MPSDEQPAIFVVTTYENQRRYPLKGWTTSMLPTDRWAWSSEDGKKERTREQLDQTLPSGYRWATDWRVVTGVNAASPSTLAASGSSVDASRIDSHGWSYAFDFMKGGSSRYHQKAGFHDWVRRRMWKRVAVRDDHTNSDGSGAMSGDMRDAIDSQFVLVDSESDHDNNDVIEAAPEQAVQESSRRTSEERSPSPAAAPASASPPTSSRQINEAAVSASSTSAGGPKEKKERPKLVDAPLKAKSRTAAKSSVAPPAPPPPPMKTAAEQRVENIMYHWERHEGSRSGQVTLDVEDLHLPHVFDSFIEVCHRSTTTRSGVHKAESHKEHYGYEALVSVADDNEPIVLRVMQESGHAALTAPVCRGEAVLSLRTASKMHETDKELYPVFTRIVAGCGTYKEYGTASLTLYPPALQRVEKDGVGAVVAAGAAAEVHAPPHDVLTADALGSIVVSWTFELRERDICPPSPAVVLPSHQRQNTAPDLETTTAASSSKLPSVSALPKRAHSHDDICVSRSMAEYDSCDLDSDTAHAATDSGHVDPVVLEHSPSDEDDDELDPVTLMPKKRKQQLHGQTSKTPRVIHGSLMNGRSPKLCAQCENPTPRCSCVKGPHFDRPVLPQLKSAPSSVASRGTAPPPPPPTSVVDEYTAEELRSHHHPAPRQKSGRLIFRPISCTHVNCQSEKPNIYLVLRWADLAGVPVAFQSSLASHSDDLVFLPTATYVIETHDTLDDACPLQFVAWDRFKFQSDKCVGMSYLAVDRFLRGEIVTLQLTPRPNEKDPAVLKHASELGQIMAFVRWIPYTC